MSIKKKKILCLQQEHPQRRLWVKRFTGGARRWRLAALNSVVKMLRLPALQAPPGRSGQAVKAIEKRRLSELHAGGVRVPEVIAEGPNELLLSDLGPTLAVRLRKASDRQALALLQASVDAIAAAHRTGCYLGQPQARNIAVDEQGRVGFLDFEEDPAEVMSVPLAQCRDWLLFASGTVRHLPVSEREFAAALRVGIGDADPQVLDALRDSLARLGPVRAIASKLGRRARGLSAAIDALRGAVAQ